MLNERSDASFDMFKYCFMQMEKHQILLEGRALLTEPHSLFYTRDATEQTVIRNIVENLKYPRIQRIFTVCFS